jgi:hypothetical protein
MFRVTLSQPRLSNDLVQLGHALPMAQVFTGDVAAFYQLGFKEPRVSTACAAPRQLSQPAQSG